jgi:Bifunctional DNA primase/polymerase, N-terminal
VAPRAWKATKRGKDCRQGRLRGMAEMIQAALSYAARGWPVFPLAVGDKVPLISKRAGGKGHLDATTDADQLTAWWKRWPAANIGVATGSRSRLLVVDVDPRHEGDVNLDRLAAVHGGMAATPMSITGSGGYHLWYAWPEGARNTVHGVTRGVDERGEGGYVAAPPSMTSPSVHPPSGGAYRWKAGYGYDEIEIAPVPQWLLEARSRVVGWSAVDPDFWSNLWLRGSDARHDALSRMTGYLIKKGLPPLMMLDMLRMWNCQGRLKPKLDDKELDRVVDAICAAEIRKGSAR